MILCVCHDVAVTNHSHIPGMPYMCRRCRDAVLGNPLWRAYVRGIMFNTEVSILLAIQEDFGA